MRDKSHKGQRHKGCGLCDQEKRAGNAADRRPARDRRQIVSAAEESADPKLRQAAVGLWFAVERMKRGNPGTDPAMIAATRAPARACRGGLARREGRLPQPSPRRWPSSSRSSPPGRSPG